MSKTAILIKAFAFCIAALCIHTEAWSQVFTLEECLEIYKNDTAFFKELDVKEELAVDTTMGSGEMYARSLRSKTDPDIAITKVVFKDTSRNQFMYSFKDPLQYRLFQNSLKAGVFALVYSNDTTTANVQVMTRIYRLKDLLISLLKVGNDSIRTNIYTLIIRRPGERDRRLRKESRPFQGGE